MPKYPTVNFSIRIPRDLVKALESEAKKNMRNRNQYIVLLLCRGLDIDPAKYFGK